MFFFYSKFLRHFRATNESRNLYYYHFWRMIFVSDILKPKHIFSLFNFSFSQIERQFIKIYTSVYWLLKCSFGWAIFKMNRTCCAALQQPFCIVHSCAPLVGRFWKVSDARSSTQTHTYIQYSYEKFVKCTSLFSARLRISFCVACFGFSFIFVFFFFHLLFNEMINKSIKEK